VAILVVDDNRAMRLLMCRALRQVGYARHELLEAGAGHVALRTARERSLELVLCDWNMPMMTGLEVLRTLRAEGSAVPFGFVTADVTEERRQLAEASGAQFVLPKPFRAEDLADALVPLLGAA